MAQRCDSKPGRRRASFTQTYSDSEVDDVQSPMSTQAEWESKEILGMRKRGRGKQVLVQWVDLEKPTWEPMQNFLGTEAARLHVTAWG
jgi:hypothetical protein